MIDFLSDPIPTDLAYGWIKAVFPDSSDQPYGQAFAIFTSSLTFLGALFMGWHIMVGIVTSAYSGKVLGERYHQIWAPLRVVLGFGMLVPIAGGFSTVHYLLRDVVGVAAVQMANAPIVAYINGMVTNPPGLSPASMQGKSVADSIVNLQVCASVVDGINSVVDPWVWQKAKSNVRPAMDPVSGGFRWDFGDCGSFFLNTPDFDGEFADASTGKVQAFATIRANATHKLMADLSSNSVIDYPRFGEFFATKHFDEKMAATHVNDLRKSSIISGHLIEDIDKAVEEWNAAVSAAAKDVFADSSTSMRDNLTKRISEYGFMVAGSYERSLSQMSSMAAGFAGDQPVVYIGTPGSTYEQSWKGAQSAIVAARQAETREAGSKGSQEVTDGSSMWGYVMSVLGPMLSSLDPADPNSGDPVGDMINRGHNLVAGAQAGIIALGLAHAASEGIGFLSSLPGPLAAASGALTYFSSWIGYVLMISLLVGIMHAYVLPMIPMIMVFVMGVSWLVLFLEAAIAGVLWAFAFIRMDGQEFFDRNQAPGVTLLFNLFLRPAIGMLAFIGGLILMPVLLRGLATIWDDAFAIQTDGLWVNSILVGWIVSIVMFMWMQWHLYLRVWGLVPTIADRVGHWMGMSMHGYNDGQETQAASGAMIAAGAAMAKAPIIPQGGSRGPRGPNPSNLTPPGAESKTSVNNMAGRPRDPGKSRNTTPRG